MLRVAEADVRRERRELAEAQTKLARRVRYADTDHANKRKPKIVMNARKREAQVSAGKLRTGHEQRLDAARDELAAAEAHVRDDAAIRIDLPGTAVPAGRTVATVDDEVIRGPERIGLVGPNGSGKTTLLRRIVAHVPVGYLPQRLDVLDDAASVLDNVRASGVAPAAGARRAGPVPGERATPSTARRARCRAANGSGSCWPGCCWPTRRRSSCCWTSRPTTSTSTSVDRLVEALAAYRGALVVASHDLDFLERIGVQRWWRLTAGGA